MKDLKDLKKELTEKYKYCPLCKQRTSIFTNKEDELFVIDCSSMSCSGIFVVVDFEGEVIEHSFSFSEEKDTSYCGLCGDVILDGECSCKKRN